jgi:hypothetical protein
MVIFRVRDLCFLRLVDRPSFAFEPGNVPGNIHADIGLLDGSQRRRPDK